MNDSIEPFLGAGAPAVRGDGFLARIGDRKVKKAATNKGRDLATANALNQGTTLELQQVAAIGQQAAARVIAQHYDGVTSLYQAVAQDVRDGVVPEWLAAEEFERLSGYLSRVTGRCISSVEEMVAVMGRIAVDNHARQSARYRK